MKLKAKVVPVCN